jgi:general secretion pathway protein H
MQISAPGRTDPGHLSQRGLTLVELLVVLLIVGVAAGIVIFSIPDGREDERSAMARFEQDVISARDQAIAENTLYGIEPVPGGYTVYRLVAEGWLPIESRAFPDDMRFELLPEDAFELPEHREEIGFGLPPREEPATAALSPDLLFAADGSVTPFTAVFAGRDGRQALKGDPFGTVEEVSP